jgi:hypothetical protein
MTPRPGHEALLDPGVADTSFFTDGRPYLTSRQAALYVGYTPRGDGALHRDDPAMRAFYEWIRRARVPKLHRGRIVLFRRTDLDAAIGEPIIRDTATRWGHVEELARRLARGE